MIRKEERGLKVIFNKKSFKARECTLCGRFLTKKDYCQTKSLFFPDGYTPICRSCLSEIVVDQEGDWEYCGFNLPMGRRSI